MKNLIALFLALCLFAAVPALGQIVTMPSPAGVGAGGGGGGGDASAANQTTQIGALPLEDVPHVSGDRGNFMLGVANQAQTALSSADGDYTPLATDRVGHPLNVPMHTQIFTDAQQLGKLESSAHVDNDAGSAVLGVVNSGLGTRASDGQYVNPATNTWGAAFAIPLTDPSIGANRKLGHNEDTAHGSGDGGIPSWGVIHTGLGNVGAIGDYSQFSTDLAGRQYNIPMTTPNTAITFQLGKTEDSAQSAGDTGVPAMRQRRDTLIADASVSADGDFHHSFSDNRGATWTHNDPVDAQLDFHVAETVTATGTAINVSGVNTVLIHATTDGSWDRTATLDFEAALGGGPLSAVRTVPHIAWQDPACSSDQPPTARFANPSIPTVSGNQCGYLVDVRGFQTLRVNMTIAGGTAGTISIHGHVVKNGDGIWKMMSLANYATDLGGVPDFGTLIVGLSPAGIGGTAASLPISRAGSHSYVAADRGIPSHFINNETQVVINASALGYLPAAVDAEARQIMLLSHNSALSTSARATQAEDSAHAFGAIGMLDLGITNETFTTMVSGATDDYVGPARNREGQQQMTLHYSTRYTGAAQVPKLEDSPAGNGDQGLIMFGRRNDNRATGHIGADGDMGLIALTEQGEVWIPHTGAAFFAITDTAIAAASQNFSFGFTSKKVFISAPATNSDGVCIDHAGGTAVCPSADTAGDDVLEPGESISIDEHAITSVSAISVSGTNTIVIRAFN